MARCLLRDHHPADARRLLSPFLLDETRQQNVPKPMIAGMRYLIALAFAEESLHSTTSRLADDGFVSFQSAALEMPFYLDEISTPAKSRDEKASAPALKLKKESDAFETLVLCAEQNDQSAANLLDRLATIGRSHFAPRAAKLASGGVARANRGPLRSRLPI
jgi:hypothetical protein